MELIRKIKETEKQAKQIVEQAKADVTKMSDELKVNRLESFAVAQSERRKSIESSKSEAKKLAEKEVEYLKKAGQADKQKLNERVNLRVPSAVSKVVEFLKG